MLLTQVFAEEPLASAPLVRSNEAAMKQAFEQVARREAAMSAAVGAYNKKPRRKYVTPRTADPRAAYYYVQWKQKIERVGSANYPAGSIPADHQVTAKVQVTILPSGALESVEVIRSSGIPEVDRYIARIAQLASPYDRPSNELLGVNNRLSFVSSWTFGEATDSKEHAASAR